MNLAFGMNENVVPTVAVGTLTIFPILTCCRLLLFITARSELRKVRFWALSLTFLFAYETSREPLNGFAPNSHGRRNWSIARMSLHVKVKGQRSRSPETKRHFSALSVACVRFTFGKTSLAGSLFHIDVRCRSECFNGNVPDCVIIPACGSMGDT